MATFIACVLRYDWNFYKYSRAEFSLHCKHVGLLDFCLLDITWLGDFEFDSFHHIHQIIDLIPQLFKVLRDKITNLTSSKWKHQISSPGKNTIPTLKTILLTYLFRRLNDEVQSMNRTIEVPPFRIPFRRIKRWRTSSNTPLNRVFP